MSVPSGLSKKELEEATKRLDLEASYLRVLNNRDYYKEEVEKKERHNQPKKKAKNQPAC